MNCFPMSDLTSRVHPAGPPFLAYSYAYKSCNHHLTILRGWDSNPRAAVRRPLPFQDSAIDRSATSHRYSKEAVGFEPTNQYRY